MPSRPGKSPPRKRRQKGARSEEHTSELQSLAYLVCRLLLEKKKSQARNVSRDRFGAVADPTGWLRPFKGMGITIPLQTSMATADLRLERGTHGVAVEADARL